MTAGLRIQNVVHLVLKTNGHGLRDDLKAAATARRTTSGSYSKWRSAIHDAPAVLPVLEEA